MSSETIVIIIIVILVLLAILAFFISLKLAIILIILAILLGVIYFLIKKLVLDKKTSESFQSLSKSNCASLDGDGLLSQSPNQLSIDLNPSRIEKQNSTIPSQDWYMQVQGYISNPPNISKSNLINSVDDTSSYNDCPEFNPGNFRHSNHSCPLLQLPSHSRVSEYCVHKHIKENNGILSSIDKCGVP